MEVPVFDRLRAVEILEPGYGTGYRVGGRLVLTVAHLFPEGTGSKCLVRSWNKNAREEWKKEADVIWTGAAGEKGFNGSPEQDIAMVLLPEEVEGVNPILFGRVPLETGPKKIPFCSYGFPEWAWTRAVDGLKTGGRVIEGHIYLADTASLPSLRVLEPERLPPEAPNLDQNSAWAGISGAAVICADMLIGIIIRHQNPERPASLEAIQLDTFSNDEGFKNIFQQYDIPLQINEIPGAPKKKRDYIYVLKALGGIAILVLILFIVFNPFKPQFYEQVISGTVYNEQGSPIPEVEIYLPKFNKSYTTNPRGRFEAKVKAVHQEKVEILAKKQGYQPREQNATLGNTKVSITTDV